MGRTVTIGAFQVKVKPRPLVGTKTFVKATERDMRDHEWSESFCASGREYRSNPRAGLKYLRPRKPVAAERAKNQGKPT